MSFEQSFFLLRVIRQLYGKVYLKNPFKPKQQSSEQLNVWYYI